MTREAGIPIEELKLRGIYAIRSRNLISGAWDGKAFQGIRSKFDSRYLFGEEFHDGKNPYGTATPFRFIEMMPEGVALDSRELFARLDELDKQVRIDIQKRNEEERAEYKRARKSDLDRRVKIRVLEELRIGADATGLEFMRPFEEYVPVLKAGEETYYTESSAVAEGEGRDVVWAVKRTGPYASEIPDPQYILPGKLKYEVIKEST